MLSEVVLQHLDRAGERGRKTIYLRYVDDIKVIAKDDEELRRRLMALDLASKEIGLFAQTAKINMRTLTEPDEEVKSVSRPPEPALRPNVDQEGLVARICELSRNGAVKERDETRFKYLLAFVRPTHRLNARSLGCTQNSRLSCVATCHATTRYLVNWRRTSLGTLPSMNFTSLLMECCFGRAWGVYVMSISSVSAALALEGC